MSVSIRIIGLIIGIFCFLGQRVAIAQDTTVVFKEDTTVRLIINGNVSTVGFSGGFNNPQFALADLNHDGKNDLVVFEKVISKITTFLNAGTPTSPVYTYAPHYAKNFPVIISYLILKDYNCDGIADLFHLGNGYTDMGNTGMAVYKGYYNAKNELCFAYYKNLYYDNHPVAVGSINLYVIPTDIPSIIDVDGDGDLDVVAYTDWGAVLNLWVNRRVEDNLPCDSMRMKLKDLCWGKVSQGVNREHTLGVYCGPDVAAKTSGTNKETHGGNSPCVFDYDGDGDMDYLDGNVFFDELVYLRNAKAQGAARDSMVYQDTTWPSNGHIVNLPQWPSVYPLDLDADGVQELLISPHSENTSENYKCIWKYKRTGSGAATNYVFQTDTFLVDNTVDVGSGSYPFLYDYNKDGKLDLFVGSDGYYQAGGTFRSKLSYYQNTTIAGVVTFQLVTKDIMNVFNLNKGGSYPAIGDLNNDGKDDLVLGHTDGTLTFYSNNAASNAVQPSWQLNQMTLLDENNATVSVSGYASPVIYDIDKDNKPDLLIGAVNGRIYYYKNTSTASGQLKLTLMSTSLGNIQVAPSSWSPKCTPFVGHIDNSGKEYMLCGNDDGIIKRFDGFQNGNTTIPYTRLDSFYSKISVGQHAAVAVGDVDGDGKYEMFVGNERGGLYYYKQSIEVAVVNSINNVNAALRSLQLYPNPATETVIVGTNGDLLSTDADLVLINSVGQVIKTATKKANEPTVSINVHDLPAGVYMCVMTAGDISYSGRFVKQ